MKINAFYDGTPISVYDALNRLGISREKLEKEIEKNDGEYAPGYFRFTGDTEQARKAETLKIEAEDFAIELEKIKGIKTMVSKIDYEEDGNVSTTIYLSNPELNGKYEYFAYANVWIEAKEVYVNLEIEVPRIKTLNGYKDVILKEFEEWMKARL